MSLKSKAKAARKREHLKRQAAIDAEVVAKRAVKLKTMTTGFARTKRSPEVEEAFQARKIPVYALAKPVSHAGDETERFTGKTVKNKPSLSPEMEARDQAAQARTREVQKRVDIGYNKGGLMLLSESEFQAMKRGELKRRS
jgi:hypothetical protein